MRSRERLLRAAEITVGAANGKRVRTAAQLLLLVGLAFVVLRLRAIWHDGHADVARVDWLELAAAFALSVVALAASGLIWLGILRRVGARPHLRWVGIFFQAQLGKYVPGSVWQYAGRTASAAAEGVPARVCAGSIGIELGSSALAAGTLALLLVGWLGALGLVAAAIVLGAIVARPGGRMLETRSWIGAGLEAWLFYLAVWPLLGLGFWLCASAVTPTPSRDIPYFAASFAVAWLAGLVAVYAPGGIGVREAVLVALLAGRIGAAEALLAATASRGILTLADLALGATGPWLLRRTAPRAALEPPLAPVGERRASTPV